MRRLPSDPSADSSGLGFLSNGFQSSSVDQALFLQITSMVSWSGEIGYSLAKGSMMRNSHEQLVTLVFNLFNSLPPGRSWCDFKNVIFNLALLIGIFKSSNDNILRWMPQVLTGHKSTLVQVMAWCHQATSPYLSQYWPRSLLPYGITRPQWLLLRKLISILGSWEAFLLNIIIEMALLVEILPCRRHGPVSPVQSLPGLLKLWEPFYNMA